MSSFRRAAVVATVMVGLTGCQRTAPTSPEPVPLPASANPPSGACATRQLYWKAIFADKTRFCASLREEDLTEDPYSSLGGHKRLDTSSWVVEMPQLLQLYPHTQMALNFELTEAVVGDACVNDNPVVSLAYVTNVLVLTPTGNFLVFTTHQSNMYAFTRPYPLTTAHSFNPDLPWDTFGLGAALPTTGDLAPYLHTALIDTRIGVFNIDEWAPYNGPSLRGAVSCAKRPLLVPINASVD